MDRNSFIQSVYGDLCETDSYKMLAKSFPLIGVASKLKIALCGSMAVHLTNKKASRVPADIDFVTDSNDCALKFVLHTIMLFEKYHWYGSVLIQNKTKFCFDGTAQHYKIKSSFGVNICVMVLCDRLNYWFNPVGICIQKHDDLIKYLKAASEKDGKNREELHGVALEN